MPGPLPPDSRIMHPRACRPTSKAVATCSCLAGDRQPAAAAPQRGQALYGPKNTLAQSRGAVVEQDRVDALHPGSVLGAQVVVGLQQCPAL